MSLGDFAKTPDFQAVPDKAEVFIRLSARDIYDILEWARVHEYLGASPPPDEDLVKRLKLAMQLIEQP